MEILRNKKILTLASKLAHFPIVAILGARQCGKTTLARQYSHTLKSDSYQFYDCEDPRDLVKLENPMLLFEKYKGLVIIDEIQRRPDIFPVLRVLVDNNKHIQFLILGSASRDLISQSSETLAGRIHYMELSGFDLSEIDQTDWRTLWVRGGFPLSFLAKSAYQSVEWREGFIRTFLERDIPNLGIKIPPLQLRRFWTMLAHFHGNIFNASDLGRSLNIADKTSRRYLDLLSGTFVIRQLQPWLYNTKKRLIKRPKVYFRDSGLFHHFLDLQTENDLMHHPKLGASWEGFALEHTILRLGLREDEAYFWAVHTGAEMDLVFRKNGRLWGIEIKYNEAPRMTKSIYSAISELELQHVWVVHPGTDNYPLDKKITAIGLARIGDIIQELDN